MNINEHYIESDKGYRITKGRNISMESFTYVAHAPNGKFFAFVSSAKEAVKACEDHFQQQHRG
ncbi:MAG TPA: hypothetical protein VLF09_03055 [Cellvibrio sp.]|nr:hypothetical protein [Cellvibrio sp.]